MWYYSIFYIEVFGLFWVAAELCILYLIRLASKAVRSDHSQFAEFSAYRSHNFEFFAVLTILCLGILILRTPLSELPQPIVPTEVNAYEIARVASQIRVHLVIWSAFILTWVGLEIAIVWTAWRAFHELRERLLQADLLQGKAKP